MKSGYTVALTKRFEGIFPRNLAINYHGNINDFTDVCSSLELELWDPRDLALTQELDQYMQTTRDLGIDTTVHLPFMHAADSKQPQDCKLLWMVVPEAYNGFLKAEELPLEVYKKAIDFAAPKGIKYFTLHVTTHGTFFTPEEFNSFSKKLGILAEYAESRNARICVETGGIREDELLELIDIHPVDITLDIAHADIDGIGYEQFYQDNKDRIPVIHISQTEKGQDLHYCISKEMENGLDVASFLQTLRKDKHLEKYIVYECQPHPGIKEFAEVNLEL